MTRWLKAPSPSLVISLAALFVALGGTAYAATRLPSNSVGTAQLKKGAVTSSKIKDGAVTGSKIKALSFVHIKPINGWSAYSGQRAPAYAVDAQGVVHFEGALFGGASTSSVAFMMPAGLFTSDTINLVADENSGTTGRIQIQSDGSVSVVDDPDHIGSGQAFVSLEGLSYLSGS